MPRTSPSLPLIGVNAVALAAGVSAMTVSRVFQNSPRVLPETRDRVLAAAQKSGYRPNPQAARLMEIVRSHRSRHTRAMIGLIRDIPSNGSPQGEIINYVGIEDIRRRAGQHGYDVEEFRLGRGGVSPARLRAILQARGITGVLVSVQSPTPLSEQFDYGGLASATFGYGLASPQLHRASTNMTQGILAATAKLEARGYQRIGMAISPWIDARADHTYSGALLHYQQTVPARRRVPLLMPENISRQGKTIFTDWMHRHRPDVVISFHASVPQWLRDGLKLRIPEDVGLVVHDWVDEPGMAGFAGINHRRSHVAAAAVDLVATQLRHNEQGVPEVPRQILIPPLFVDGPSIRPAS
ncbi:MAG: LacI family DNA-binding transcriptional regulator [Opitutaceae bacterium]|jgi:LacI family transcriptional regulator